VKALRDADDGDARGRRHLLGGIVMGETLKPDFYSGGGSGTAASFPHLGVA
jgi:hypothetical protein